MDTMPVAMTSAKYPGKKFSRVVSESGCPGCLRTALTVLFMREEVCRVSVCSDTESKHFFSAASDNRGGYRGLCRIKLNSWGEDEKVVVLHPIRIISLGS